MKTIYRTQNRMLSDIISIHTCVYFINLMSYASGTINRVKNGKNYSVV